MVISDNNNKILTDLIPEFAKKVTETLFLCENNGIQIILIEGLRNPFRQAALWRFSKSPDEVYEKIKLLKSLKAYFLAYCLEVVGEHHGQHVTNALPGLSWHQYGMAVDVAWIVESKICWENEKHINGLNGYEVLASAAGKVGIFSGHNWLTFKDSGHLQNLDIDSPNQMYSWIEIDNLMKENFSYLVRI